MNIRFCLSLVFWALLAFYGCGGGSAAVEMKEAQKAIDQAKSLHAEDLAPTDFQLAQRTWDHAQGAAKEGKSDTAKVLFVSSKIYFEKASDIARSKQEALSRELKGMQLVINSNLDQVKSDLSKKSLSPQQQGQVKAIASEVTRDKASINKLVQEDDYLKAVATAKDVQSKLYNAQLILAGQRPVK